jgi:hypothetical protein
VGPCPKAWVPKISSWFGVFLFAGCLKYLAQGLAHEKCSTCDLVLDLYAGTEGLWWKVQGSVVLATVVQVQVVSALLSRYLGPREK